MKTSFYIATLSVVALIVWSILLSSYKSINTNNAPISFPYKSAGLTKQQAAAHLLSRFSFGAKDGEVDAVVKLGLEKWFQQQLDAKNNNDSLEQIIAQLGLLKLSNAQVSTTFPRGGQLIRMAVEEGVIHKDSVGVQKTKEYRERLDSFMDAKGLKPERELFRQFIAQKIYSVAYSNNQLQEVLTDFWFNHFNVSITKNQCAHFIPNYEKNVIRPNAIGKFEDLLLATAKSPAMLLYLDNFSSSGITKNTNAKRPAQNNKQGLNENYARELMELHTLGVDGGYTQEDVTQAAGVLTGWTIYPMGGYGNNNAVKKQLDKIAEGKLAEKGFVHEGDFLFAPNRHDNTDKLVLGRTFKGSDGYQAGEALLKMLAQHPSTANFICKKLAIRFVSNAPSEALVEKMTGTFLDKKGDIKEVLLTMVSSAEFWSKDVIREKTKSPLELVISSIRYANAQVYQPYQLFTWLDKMGQKIYYYQSPAGFPDKGEYWISTSALLNRMNFGLAFSQQRIPGIKFQRTTTDDNTALGVMIGSPEFQRR